MSSSRRNNGGRAKKKAKVEEEEELWTKFEDLPPLPPRRMVHGGYMYPGGVKTPYETDLNERERYQYRSRLIRSILKAIQEGSCEFVRKVLQQQQKTSSFNLRELLENDRNCTWGMQKNRLIVTAIGSNQFDMLGELVQLEEELGLDVNYRTHHRNYPPLMLAIHHGRVDMIRYLINHVPTIQVTCPNTTLYRTGNGRSRPRCEHTALSLAASYGQLDIVRLLIEKGKALLASSTTTTTEAEAQAQDEDDDYRDHRNWLKLKSAQEIVDFSAREALLEAFENAANPQYGRGKATEKDYADILELLLSKMGAPTPKNDAITIYITDKIYKDDWYDIHSQSSYSYSYNLYDDKDFDRKTKEPSLRAIAVVRGLRMSLIPSVWLVAAAAAAHKGDDDNNDGTNAPSIQFLEGKYQFWMNLCRVCKQRLKAAGSGWMKEVDNLYSQDLPEDQMYRIRNALRRTQLLLWCQLFTSPWSPQRHFVYYPPPVRFYIRELLHIGSTLDRRHHSSNNNAASSFNGSFKEVWDQEIIPFVID